MNDQQAGGIFLPLAFIFSTLMHMGAAYAVFVAPNMHGGPVFPGDVKVRFIELPEGRGGATEPEITAPEEATAPEPPRLPPTPKETRTTLPGDEKPEPEPSTSPVRTPKRGETRGIGHDGKAGLGGKGKGVILDQADFEYLWYQARLEDALRANWRKPPPKKGRTVSASVHFVIMQTGEVMDVRLMQSSSDPVFDRSVLRAVRDAAPYPKFPPAYARDRLGVLYTFELLPEN